MTTCMGPNNLVLPSSVSILDFVRIKVKKFVCEMNNHDYIENDKFAR